MNSRIKININTGEFEFEGTEEFVTKQLSSLPETFKMVNALAPHHKEQSDHGQVKKHATTDSQLETPVSGEIVIPNTFGEWYNRFPQKMQQIDKMLISGYYYQIKVSTDNTFKTIQANRLLIEQSVKVSNPSDTMTGLQENKFVFIVKKEGKLSLFRVSKDGEAYIVNLLKSTHDVSSSSK